MCTVDGLLSWICLDRIRFQELPSLHYWVRVAVSNDVVKVIADYLQFSRSIFNS